jgi:hypothetical protein
MREAMAKENVLDALAVSGLREAGAAAQLLEGGDLETHSVAAGPCEGVLLIYQLRLDHLRSLPGAHARRLAEAVSEFVGNLERNGGDVGRWLTIKGSQELFFGAFCLDNGQILGCLPLVSKLDVSPERWTELWGGNA